MQQVSDTDMTPGAQSQQVTVEKVNISVEAVYSNVVTHETKVTKQKYRFLCIYCLEPF